MKKIYIVIPIIVAVAAGFWFWRQSQVAPGYYGLPVVACIDSTRPIIQDFSFKIKIVISGKDFSIDPNMGHDP